MFNNRHIIDYLRGKRRGRKANRMEREAMQDPFLSEALEGYDKHSGNHANDIFRLQQAVVLSAQRRRNTLWWAAAACIIGLLGIGTFIFLPPSGKQTFSTPSIAENAEQELKIIDTIQAADLLAAKEERKPAQEHEQLPKAGSAAPKLVLPTQEMMEDVAFEADIIVQFAEEASILIDDEKRADEPAPPQAAAKNKINFLVQGRITDSDNTPIPGAVVIVEGTKNAKFTDESGNFSMYINSLDNKLIAYYVGMQISIFQPDTNAIMLIAMQEGNLDEVVIEAKDFMKKGSSYAGQVKALPQAKPAIGKKAYLKYIKDNLRHPADATCNANLTGRVVLHFRVSADGRPYDIKIAQSLCQSYDEEAIRLIKEGSNWQYNAEQVEYRIEF